MLEKNKNTAQSFYFRFVITAVVFGLAFLLWQKTQASTPDCDLLVGNAKQQCQDLEAKAQTYQDLIDIKNQQQDTLQKQMTLIDAEQSRNQNDLAQTKNQAESLTQQIEDLNRQIADKESSI